jgi:hypothetical protein
MALPYQTTQSHFGSISKRSGHWTITAFTLDNDLHKASQSVTAGKHMYVVWVQFPTLLLWVFKGIISYLLTYLANYTVPPPRR